MPDSREREGSGADGVVTVGMLTDIRKEQKSQRDTLAVQKETLDDLTLTIKGDVKGTTRINGLVDITNDLSRKMNWGIGLLGSLIALIAGNYVIQELHSIGFLK
jgi:phosphoribosyl-dephospho-CoA transferase